MSTPRSHRVPFMQAALEEARLAAVEGEIPVGAVAVLGNRIIARAHNRREQAHDPCAHAEVLLLREAGAALGSWRLSGVDVYVTLEPCPMCAAALVHARVRTVVFGALDPKAGGVRSLFALCEDPRLNHRVEVLSGICAESCTELLQQFFTSLRENRDPDVS
jgi:tRNA(adenine34) deaminase